LTIINQYAILQNQDLPEKDKKIKGGRKMFRLKFVIFFVALSLLLASLPVMATEEVNEGNAKKVEVNATVDVGQNTKQLLDQGGNAVTKIIADLAKSLGMTVEKIFPYYVKQSYLQGLLYMYVWGGFEIILLIISIILFKFYRVLTGEGSTTAGVLAVIALIVFGIGLVVGVFCLPSWITLIKNPEYDAIHRLIEDASILLLKR
jgi:hypothetical protein